MFKRYLEEIGKDSRSAEEKQGDVSTFKDVESQMIDYINQFSDKTEAFDLNNSSGFQDLLNGDIGIKINNSTFKVDVKKNPFVSLNSIFKFKGPYYLFVLDSGNFMVAKKDIVKWLTEFSPEIFNIQLDNRGNLKPESKDLFMELKKVSSDKVKLIIMPRSGTPGIFFNKEIFWNTLDKFLNYFSRGK